MKLQTEQQKLDQQAKEKQMEMELRKLRLDKTSEDDFDESLGHSSSHHYVTSKMPKMPYFGENTDCMDAYLNRFEKVADDQGWKTDNLSICLLALLSGKALDAYSCLPPDQANDYECLKQASLKRKFRTAKPELGESPAQFLTHLSSYLQRWVELSKVEQTYEGLASLIVRK